MTAPIQIIYVDDEPALLDIGKIYLERSTSCQITTFESAIEALPAIQSGQYDAIISDYQMPDIDGIEFLSKVRASGSTIPFILFTGRGREEVVIQALNEGADFYLQKGGDPGSQFAELAHKVRQAVLQRRLEEQVRNAERREADIIDFLPDATFAIDSEGVIIAWNRAMERMTGLSSDQMIGQGNYEYALPFYQTRRPMLINLVMGDDPLTAAKYTRIKKDGEHLSTEITLPIFRGVERASFWFTASPLYNSQGTMVGAIESIRDITENKRAEEEVHRKHEELHAAYEEITATEEELRSNLEELCRQENALRESKRRLSHMASNIPGVAYRFVVNPDGSFVLDFIGERSREILGIKNDPETFFDDMTRGIGPSAREQFFDSISQAVRNQEPWKFEGEFQKPSGEKIWIRAISNPAREGETLLFDGIIFDETAHKVTDDLVHLLIRITDDIPVSIMVHDDAGTILYANDHLFRLLGYTRDEFLAKNIRDIDAPGSERMINELIGKIRAEGRGELDMNHVHRDGSLIPLHVTVKVIEWKGREVFVSIATEMKADISE